MDHGWSLKALHRYLLMSATYQQASDPGTDPAVRAAFARNEAADSANQLWWRMNRKRADFEALRDSLLAASGSLDEAMGGQPVQVFEGVSAPRRTLYGFIDRQNLPGLLRAFDFASPDSTASMRYQTTVPQQALFLLNSPFMADRAREFVAQSAVASAPSRELKLERMHELAFQRPPTDQERVMARAFLDHPVITPITPPPAAFWSYGTGELQPDGHLRNWRPLARFVKDTWQHDTMIPDSRNRFTHLNARGGHPGPSPAESVVRRWTAPAKGSYSVTGSIDHPSESGDGIRALVISSRHGVLGDWTVLHRKETVSLNAIILEAGDTLDFVVSPGASDNSDSFTWAPAISETGSAGMRPAWDARRDFQGPVEQPVPLTPLEQYAQVLLSANEFVFVD